jgi:RES domain-containing protein
LRFLWRISNHVGLEGLGGEKTDGRWHTAKEGKRIIYFAEHPALALVEILVNLRGRTEQFPEHFQLLKISVDESVSTKIVEIGELSERWRHRSEETQAIGDGWLEEQSSALLRVPSVPSPESCNYLFNPLHQDAKGLVLEWHKWIEYDQRLFHTVGSK